MKKNFECFFYEETNTLDILYNIFEKLFILINNNSKDYILYKNECLIKLSKISKNNRYNSLCNDLKKIFISIYINPENYYILKKKYLTKILKNNNITEPKINKILIYIENIYQNEKINFYRNNIELFYKPIDPLHYLQLMYNEVPDHSLHIDPYFHKIMFNSINFSGNYLCANKNSLSYYRRKYLFDLIEWNKGNYVDFEKKYKLQDCNDVFCDCNYEDITKNLDFDNYINLIAKK